MKKITCIFFLMIFVFGIVGSASARQGCCSHHGGVCGCKCCDGSSLSAKCAPYYPDCKEDKPVVKMPNDSKRVTPSSKQ